MSTPSPVIVETQTKKKRTAQQKTVAVSAAISAQVNDLARKHRWSWSTAAAVLIEEGLAKHAPKAADGETAGVTS